MARVVLLLLSIPVVDKQRSRFVVFSSVHRGSGPLGRATFQIKRSRFCYTSPVNSYASAFSLSATVGVITFGLSGHLLVLFAGFAGSMAVFYASYLYSAHQRQTSGRLLRQTTAQVHSLDHQKRYEFLDE
jgi:lysozyme family protein